MMTWIQVVLETDTQHVEQLSETLTTLGALSVSWQDAASQPIYEPPLHTTPLWAHIRMTALFAQETDVADLEVQLQHQLAETSPYQITYLPEQVWSRVALADFKPMCFGERLWICPSWQTPPHPEATNILLDPGLAFGTGTHPTTALCLEWLDQQVDLSGKTLIDYGCGSGILAIAAAKLGAAQVWVVDHDPQALFATEENARQNGVAECIISGLPAIKVDGLLANILAAPLIELKETFAACLQSGAPVILSGILSEQAEAIIAAYTPYFDVIQQVERDNWVRIVAKRH